jgi:hypothetical protein
MEHLGSELLKVMRRSGNDIYFTEKIKDNFFQSTLDLDLSVILKKLFSDH